VALARLSGEAKEHWLTWSGIVHMVQGALGRYWPTSTEVMLKQNKVLRKAKGGPMALPSQRLKGPSPLGRWRLALTGHGQRGESCR